MTSSAAECTKGNQKRGSSGRDLSHNGEPDVNARLEIISENEYELQSWEEG